MTRGFVKPTLLAIAGAVALLFAAWVVVILPFARMGHSTPYCPIGHRIFGASSCAVLDADGRRLLIQHADLDLNVYYLEIREPDGGSRYFDYPISDGQLAPQGFSAALIPGSHSAILVDGHPFDLKPQ